MREAWSDDRLDALNYKVDERFEVVDGRFGEMGKRLDRIDGRLDRIDQRFERLEDKLDERLYSIQRTMLVGVFALSSAFMAGFAGMITLVATQT